MKENALRFLVLIVALLVQSGCASVPKRNPIPEELHRDAEISGIPLARSWGDGLPEYSARWLEATPAELRAHYSGIYGVPHTYLAISGGGSNGAFGAGLLNGWTAAGDRPEFTVVTGISTGALIAPFAFLGPKYDSDLKHVYTQYSTRDLIKKRSMLNAITSDAASSSKPMQELLERHITDAMVREIAAEHRKGRRLLIGTTNLDAQRPVIWSLGAIAASESPDAAQLIRTVLLASASIPAVFPPVLITVEADGRSFDELHVDGGATSQVFFYPIGMDWDDVLKRLKVPGRPRVYVIRNSRLEPEWKIVENKFTAILGHSLSSLIRTQGIGDLYRIYLAAQRDDLEFRLARIPDDFDEDSEEEFDREYMGKLFQRGYKMALAGYPWEDHPPEMDAELPPPR